jgi:lysozyme
MQLLRLHEGYRQFPYLDTVGELTIGIGRNLNALGIGEHEANMLLRNDLNRCYGELIHHLPYFVVQTETRKIVLLDMCFNLGIKKLLSFKRTLKHIKDSEYEQASKEMLNSKWARQVGNRAVRLSEMMRTNLWPSDI